MPSYARYQSALQDYLEEGGPNSSGEWGLRCPLHDDRRRSASINFIEGVWFCQACEIGGTVRDLVKHLDREAKKGERAEQEAVEPTKRHELLDESWVSLWHTALMGNPDRMRALHDRRGIFKRTMRHWQLGWDERSKAYTIPIRDETGDLQNIRRYQLDPPPGKRKIWSLTGHGAPILFPLEALEGADEIVICEGEWDAILTLQKGFTAITRTGTAKAWDTGWNKYFKGKTVFLCHDMDNTGQAANHKLLDTLAAIADEVHIVKLPYQTLEDHGKDLTDYWREGYNLMDFTEMLYGHTLVNDQPEAQPISAVNVLSSFDSRFVGQPLKMRVTITGKRNPPYLAPEQVLYTCSMDAGPKCAVCPLKGFGGDHKVKVEPYDSVLLEIMNSTSAQVAEILRQYEGIQKCHLLNIDVQEYQAIEELYVRPSVEVSRNTYGEAGDFTHRKIVSVGRHDSLPNNTVEMVGTVYPSPRTQSNEFQAWDVNKTETSIDKFELTPRVRELLDLFKPRRAQRPLAKLAEISADLAAHVTKIYGRNELHALMDLVWHSAVSFDFQDNMVHRGWLEALVVGDTRTGKSEIAQKLMWHYGAGEYVSCESASFAGVVGGLQQIGSREWEVTWGAIPINDRRLVVLDEISGLSFDSIQSMSSIRSSGEAQLTKIRSERTWARTRLIWLGNPRDARMDSYTYGVQAIKPLIGNNEDIARFDIAMSVRSDDVSADEINQEHHASRPHVYNSEACEACVLWAWSRRPEQIVFVGDAIAAIYEQSLALGGRYVEMPPLIQGANVRIKLARLAVALAIRTVSTDASYEQVLVNRQHVEDAVKFIDTLYGNPSFGYAEYSKEMIADAAKAEANREKVRGYLTHTKGLAKFLRATGGFRRQDMEETMNMSKEAANAIINRLWEWRMLGRDGPDIRISPVLHDLLREVE